LHLDRWFTSKETPDYGEGRELALGKVLKKLRTWQKIRQNASSYPKERSE
jgi:hypothetical protein